jgi:hypothetical protein
MLSWTTPEHPGCARVPQIAPVAVHPDLAELAAVLGRGRDAVVVASGGLLAALRGTLLSLPHEGVVALNRVTVNASLAPSSWADPGPAS